MKHEDIEDAVRSIQDTHRDPLSTCQADHIERLLTELAALRERFEWKPIATARRVHRECIIGGTPGGYVHVWEYDEQPHHAKPKPHWSRPFHGVGYDRANQPTHWLPLPEAPR